MENTFQIGDILEYTWGYEQTNADFFQVIGITKSGKSVLIHEIKSIETEDSPLAMSGSAVPVPGAFKPDKSTIRKQIKTSGDHIILSMDYGVARKWDGLPVSYSSYA